MHFSFCYYLIVHILVSSYTASNPCWTCSVSRFANSAKLKILSALALFKQAETILLLILCSKNPNISRVLVPFAHPSILFLLCMAAAASAVQQVSIILLDRSLGFAFLPRSSVFPSHPISPMCCSPPPHTSRRRTLVPVLNLCLGLT